MLETVHYIQTFITTMKHVIYGAICNIILVTEFQLFVVDGLLSLGVTSLF